MKTIYTIIDPYPYSQLTVHEDYKYLAKQLGYDHKFYTMDQIAKEQVDRDSNEGVLFIFECALLAQTGKTTKDIRRWYPNCKIVALSTDAIVHKPGFEIFNPFEIDLWLDTHSEIVEYYIRRGLVADIWEMTTSHYLIEQYEHRPRLSKTQDFICLIGHMNPYRNSLKRVLDTKYQCQWGVHPSVADYNIDHVYESFSKSRIVLGSTSPSWSGIRTMKGYRDFLGPLCGTVLIYDNHPDVIKQFPICPLYDYDNFNSIIDLFERLINDPAEYQRVLTEQLAWVKENTIAAQLHDRLFKHQIL